MRKLAFQRGSLLACLVFALTLVSGCGGGTDEFRFKVFPTHGTVMSKGKPVARSIVRFHPTDPAAVKIPAGKVGPDVLLTTETDADGRFSMSTYLADDGIPAGDYVVTVGVVEPASDVENSDGRPAIPSKGSAIASSKKYRVPDTSPLKATVKAGENHFEFELN